MLWKNYSLARYIFCFESALSFPFYSSCHLLIRFITLQDTINFLSFKMVNEFKSKDPDLIKKLKNNYLATQFLFENPHIFCPISILWTTERKIRSSVNYEKYETSST